MSHRNLMPKLLLAPSHKGWPNFQRLLLALLRFLEPYLRNAELTDAVRLLYKVSTPCFSVARFIDSAIILYFVQKWVLSHVAGHATLHVMSCADCLWLTG